MQNQSQPHTPSQSRQASSTKIPAASSKDSDPSPTDLSSSTIGYELTKSQSTASRRRESFSLSVDQDREEIAELKLTVSNELARRKSVANIVEPVPEEAVTSRLPTPIGEMSEASVSEEEGMDFEKDIEGLGERMEGVKLSLGNDSSKVVEPVVDDNDFDGSDSAVEEDEAISSDVSEGPLTTTEEYKKMFGEGEAVNNQRLKMARAQMEEAAEEEQGELCELPSRDEIAQSEHTEKKTSAVEDEDAMLDSGSLIDQVTPTKPLPQAKTSVKRATGSLRTPGSTKSASLKPTTPGTRLSFGIQKTPNVAPASAVRSTPQSNAKSTLTKLLAATPLKTAPTPNPQSSGRKPSTKTYTPANPLAKASPQQKVSPRLLAPTASSIAHTEQPKSAVDRKVSGPRTTKPTPIPNNLLKATAASAAKHEPQEREANQSTSTTRPKKPSEVPSRLLAPTASSSAKHDNNTNPATTIRKASSSTTIKDRPNGTSRPLASTSQQTTKHPRSSLASTDSAPLSRRPESRIPSSSSATNTFRPTTTIGDSFLARMTRPTAASASRTHSKLDSRSPPPPPPPSGNGSIISRNASLRRAPSAKGSEMGAISVSKRQTSASASVKGGGSGGGVGGNVRQASGNGGAKIVNGKVESQGAGASAVNTPQPQQSESSKEGLITGLGETPSFARATGVIR